MNAHIECNKLHSENLWKFVETVGSKTNGRTRPIWARVALSKLPLPLGGGFMDLVCQIMSFISQTRDEAWSQQDAGQGMKVPSMEFQEGGSDGGSLKVTYVTAANTQIVFSIIAVSRAIIHSIVSIEGSPRSVLERIGVTEEELQRAETSGNVCPMDGYQGWYFSSTDYFEEKAQEIAAEEVEAAKRELNRAKAEASGPQVPSLS